MAVTPLFGVPMDGGAQSFDGVSQSGSQTQPMSPTDPKHHSGFQNVLGFLGDFLMSRLSMGTPYHDARENEKLNQARLLDEQSGDTTYPRTGVLNPSWAAQLQNRAIDNNRLSASMASTAESRDARVAAQKELLRKDVRTRAASYFNGLDPKSPKFAEDYARGRKLWGESATVKNDPELSQSLNEMFPEEYDPNMVHASISSTVPVAKQWDQAITKDRNAAIGDKETKTLEQGSQKIGETIRSHKANEGLGAARVAIASRRADIAASRPVRQPTVKAPRPTASDLIYLRQNPAMRDRFDGKFGVGMAKRVLGK